MASFSAIAVDTRQTSKAVILLGLSGPTSVEANLKIQVVNTQEHATGFIHYQFANHEIFVPGTVNAAFDLIENSTPGNYKFSIVPLFRMQSEQ